LRYFRRPKQATKREPSHNQARGEKLATGKQDEGSMAKVNAFPGDLSQEESFFRDDLRSRQNSSLVLLSHSKKVASESPYACATQHTQFLMPNDVAGTTKMGDIGLDIDLNDHSPTSIVKSIMKPSIKVAAQSKGPTHHSSQSRLPTAFDQRAQGIIG
jgi:hypothetical protein